MTDSISNNITALDAFSVQMGVTANNIANINTEEFKKSRAILQEGLEGDVVVEIEKIETTGPTVVETKDGQMTKKELSNVELEEEITRMIYTEKGYEANLTAIKARDEMLGTLIDIVG